MSEPSEASVSRPAELVVRPVRGGNPFEEAVERLVQAIKLGQATRGERLPPERELSLQLGVSRVTLRSAIRALQQAGYIESRRGRTGGSFVIWNPADGVPGDAREIATRMGDSLLDALQFRGVLEPGAAGLAAKRVDLTDADRDTLGERLAEVRHASPPEYRIADSRLHLAIAELSGSPSLVAAITDVQAVLSDLLRAIPVLHPAVVHSHDQHAMIVAAILEGRWQDARSAMEEHVNATASLLRGFLA